MKAEERKGKGRKTGNIIFVLVGIFTFICSGKRELYFTDGRLCFGRAWLSCAVSYGMVDGLGGDTASFMLVLLLLFVATGGRRYGLQGSTETMGIGYFKQ
jgi:hypothetical protein